MSAIAPAPLSPASPRPANPGLTPRMLNHAAWITHDVAATTDFYTRIMGMELASTIFDDRVPSTGDPIPYFHIFFRMGDGSTFAFFELPGIPPAAAPSHPAWPLFTHIALEAKDKAEVMRWYEWLRSNGIEVVGPTDHKGIIYSIYFHDPNGFRLEITTPLEKDWNNHTQQGYADLKLWLDCKEAAQREGRDVPQAMIEMIRATRKRYE